VLFLVSDRIDPISREAISRSTEVQLAGAVFSGPSRAMKATSRHGHDEALIAVFIPEEYRLAPAFIPRSRYHSVDYLRLERERIFGRTWLAACRGGRGRVSGIVLGIRRGRAVPFLIGAGWRRSSLRLPQLVPSSGYSSGDGPRSDRAPHLSIPWMAVESRWLG